MNHEQEHLELLDLHTLRRCAILPLEHSRRTRRRLLAVFGVEEHFRYENIDDLGINRELQLTIGTFEIRRQLIADRNHFKECRLRGIGRLRVRQPHGRML